MDINDPVEEKLTGLEAALVACAMAMATLLGWIIATLRFLLSSRFSVSSTKHSWDSRRDFRQHTPNQPIDTSGIIIAVVVVSVILLYASGRM